MKRIIILGVLILMGCQIHDPAVKKTHQAPLGPGNRAFEEILATDLIFDIEKGEIHYTLPEPAWVRLRVGISAGGALLRTLMDWEYRDKGTHIEKWDWKDHSGKVNFEKREDLMAVLNCRAARSGKTMNLISDLFIFKHAPEFTVTFPESSGTTRQGIPIVKGVTPLRVALNAKDQQWLTETRFEMALYVDTIFIAEEEEGVNPYTYLVNTKGFTPGEHVITVNVIGYEGQVGTQSRLIFVEN